jgi:RNA polymerase sigma factor FliA
MDSTALWQAFASGDPVARERLLTHHLGLVHHVARQLSRTLSIEADFDELVSAGTMGLMSALDSFDATRGLAFSTFAAPRIRGAILDELRRLDHVPRSIRRKNREIAAAREALMRELGRRPDDVETAERMGVDVETLWRWAAEAQGAVHVPLEQSPTDPVARSPRPLEPAATESDSPIEDRLNLDQEIDILRSAIVRLKDQERTVLALYYYEELKLHEIATILALTESRVSQIRSKALSKLRTELGSLREQVA